MPFNPTIPAMVDDSIPGLGNGTPLTKAELDTNRFQKLIENDNYLHAANGAMDTVGIFDFGRYELTDAEALLSKTIDPTGNGDYLTIAEASDAGDSILYLSADTHVLTDHVNFSEATERVLFMGSSNDNRATIDFDIYSITYSDDFFADDRNLGSTTFTLDSDLIITTNTTQTLLAQPGDKITRVDSTFGGNHTVVEVVDANTIRLTENWLDPTDTSTGYWKRDACIVEVDLVAGSNELVINGSATTADFDIVGKSLWYGEWVGEVIGIKDATTYLLSEPWWSSTASNVQLNFRKIVDRPGYWNLNILSSENYIDSPIGLGVSTSAKDLSFINVDHGSSSGTGFCDYLNYDGSEFEGSVFFNFKLISPELWPSNFDVQYFYQCAYIECELPHSMYKQSNYYRTRFIAHPGETAPYQVELYWSVAIDCLLTHEDMEFVTNQPNTVISCRNINALPLKVRGPGYYNNEQQLYTFTSNSLTKNVAYNEFDDFPTFVELDPAGYTNLNIRFYSANYLRNHRILIRVPEGSTPGDIINVKNDANEILTVVDATVGSWVEIFFDGVDWRYLNGANA